ncbi:MAG: single-stranded-DNA-specific exonuclease RecJ [Nitrospirota bacterium]
MRREKRWREKVIEPSVQNNLCKGLGIRPITAQILIKRGIIEIDDARSFLNISSSGLINPFSLEDMDKAVLRIEKAIDNNEKILIYGDYDVDGVTATSLYLSFFRDIGKDAAYYIPNRIDEGYGINREAILKIKEMGISLIITADCGTTSIEEVDLAQSLGIDIIITDHHESKAELPRGIAVLNPNRKDSLYPFKGLCGVGMALKLVHALLINRVEECRSVGVGKLTPQLLNSSTPQLRSYLDLVALGTIADVAPIRGENRYLVKEGLHFITKGERIGIRALKDISGMDGSEVGIGGVGFTLAPRINAGGRLSSANEGVELFMCRSYDRAIEIARRLDTKNRERQRIEERILQEAEEMIKREEKKKYRVIIMASPSWHPGVVGIVASRIAEKYYCPTILIALREDGIGRGSGRSISGFNLYEGINRCSKYLEGFGGHKFAVGITIRSENIAPFRAEMEKVIDSSLSDEDFIPEIYIDASVDLKEIDFQVMSEIDKLSPFGVGNPEPTLLTRGVEAFYPKIVGNNHLKMKLRDEKRFTFDAIGFKMGDMLNQLDLNMGMGRVDVVFSPKIDVWQGKKKIQFRLKDIRKSKK